MAYKELTELTHWNGIIRGVEFIDSVATDYLTNADIAYIQGVMGLALADKGGTPADIVYVLDQDNVNGEIHGVQFLNSKAVGNLSQDVISKIYAYTGMSVSVNLAPEITETEIDPMINGTAFTQTFHATGGNQPYVWSKVGALPTGLTLTSGSPNCTIAGTPSVPGTYGFTLTVSDTNQDTDDLVLSAVARASLVITNASLHKGMVNYSYTETLTATGGLAPYTFALLTGTLPTGLSIVGDDIQGTPANLTPRIFTIRVTDNLGFTSTKELSIETIEEIEFVSAELNSGIVGGAYSQQLEATGGITPYTWSIEEGELPTGLSLNATTGLISGTPAEIVSAEAITLRVQDSSSTPFVVDKEFEITITAGLVWVTTDGNLNNEGHTFVVGWEIDDLSILTTGGTQPCTFAKTAGTIPTGFVLGTDGSLIGIPTTAGNYVFDVTATDSTSPTPLTATKTYSVTVNDRVKLDASLQFLPFAMVGHNYSELGLQFVPIGGSGDFTFTGGIWYDIVLSSSGVLSGIALATQSDYVVDEVTVTDNRTSDVFATTCVLNNYDPQFDPVAANLTITETTLPAGIKDTPYMEGVHAPGGSTYNTFSLLSGTLPTGLSISANGDISGTPTVNGVYEFVIKVTDNELLTPSTFRYTDTQALSITITES